MTFRDLNLKKQLWNALDDLGYVTPTTIQHAGFNAIMSGSDVIGIAQTGTGKTVAYALPCLNMWKFSKEPHPQILIIVPTRELVVQVVKEIEKLTKYLNVAVGGVYGGANINTQTAMILLGLDILVGTPGRIMDVAVNGSLQMKHIKKVVIDEVDETLSLGFRPQLIRIFDILPPKRQHLLFSATLSEEVEGFIDAYFDRPIKVEAAPAGTPIELITQRSFNIPNFNTKINFLKYLLASNETMNRVLVFVSSRGLAEMIFAEIEPIMVEKVGIIHSGRAQNQRFNAVNEFQDGTTRVLIATDLISRGIDVEDVSHVINFDVPDNAENYVHRIGRTGRADKTGESITFITPKDESAVQRIEGLIKSNLKIDELPEEVEQSEELREFEKPRAYEPTDEQKLPKWEKGGGAFHDKKDKNKKVNVRYDHKAEMKKKYKKQKLKRRD